MPELQITVTVEIDDEERAATVRDRLDGQTVTVEGRGVRVTGDAEAA